MIASQQCLSLIRQFEGCELTSYQDPGGVWTIGYGHTGPDVYAGETIAQEEAEALLAADVAKVVSKLNIYIGYRGITQNQFDACVSLAYNIGTMAFGNSTLCKLLNEGEITAASQQFLVWDHVRGQVSQGLQNRRKKEQALFLTPMMMVIE